ncbi:hypothetical protein T484DRAFT_1927224, partial [Baffinella frigidus]
TFDFLVVAIWAALYLDEKISPAAAEGKTRNIVLWLRLLRCTKAIAMVSRVVKHVFRPHKAASGQIRRDSTGIIFMYLVVSDTRLLVLVLYVLASTFGMVAIIGLAFFDQHFTVFINPFWYCVCLFEMVKLLSTLPNVFKAITMRSQQLIQTLLLGIFAWYLFGLADVGSSLHDIAYSHPQKVVSFAYTVLYFLLISTILLNVIFGIIVDAFGELRDQQDMLKKKMLNQCFICGMDRQDFENPKVKTNFAEHLHKQHNIWHYICFVIQISLKPKTELTGTEQYVIDELAAERTDWFPALRALELEDPEGEEEGEGGGEGSAHALCQTLLREQERLLRLLAAHKPGGAAQEV